LAADVFREPPSSGAAGGIIDSMGAPLAFKRNAEIYGEHEPADYLYKVVSGAVRTSRLLSDGRRQVGAFYLPGDSFGLENGGMHSFSAEAVSDSKILVIQRSAIMALAARDGQVARELWSVTSRELERVQEHLTVLVKSAEERVAGFLLELAKRAPGAIQVQLPMSRQDIADYLGLTIETVSRTMTRLEGLSAIELPSARCVVLRDQATLGRLNS
jgi:CRP-like cAMP-binding protein